MGVSADDVLELLAAFEEASIVVWIDGGWGVDALLGEQTREHDDLDIVARLEDIGAMLDALGRWGFAVAEDHRPVRCVLRDRGGRQIDVHTVTFDAEGGGVQPQPSGGTFRYPPEGFARGSIGGSEVACVSAEVQLLCHMGYKPDEKDQHDVALLVEHYGLTLPELYR